MYAQEAAEAYGVTVPELMGHTRLSRAVDARHAVWRRLRDDGFSFPRIAIWVGRDHSTIVQALSKQQRAARRRLR